MRCQETGKRPFARNNTAAAAEGGCLRQHGGAKTARVAGGRVAGCGGECVRADEGMAPDVWHGQKQKEQTCKIRERET